MIAGAVILASGGGQAGESERDSFLTQLLPGPEQYELAAAPQIDRTMRRMSLEDKVDQLMLLGFEGTDADEPARLLERGELGGLVVAVENYDGTKSLQRLIEDTRGRARREKRTPPLFLVSQEGGELSALPDLPPDQAPADTPSVDAAAEGALTSARALKKLGLNGVLGPVLDIGAADGGAIGIRAFSDGAYEIARYARATVTAYVDAGLISAPLHFPGLGGAATSTDEGPAQVGQTVDALRRNDLLPFRTAFDAGAQAVVVGHGLYGTDDFAVPASASRFILTDMLRGELGFEGLAITDDLAAGAITIVESSAEAAVDSIAAGADMARLSGPEQEQERMREALIVAARDGRISRVRLDDAARRVLEAKRKAGLLGGKGRRGGEASRRRPPARRRPTRPRPNRREATAAIPGLDRREGRPPGPGGGFPTAPREARIPGLREREGRPPGLGGVRPEEPRPRRQRPGGSIIVPPGGTRQIVPGGGAGGTAPGTSYSVPIR